MSFGIRQPGFKFWLGHYHLCDSGNVLRLKCCFAKFVKTGKEKLPSGKGCVVM